MSGLKRLTVLGRKINKKTSYRRIELITTLSSRKPIDRVVDLENELIEIQLLVDEMERQGVKYNAEALYMNLLKSISVLMGTTNAVLFEAFQHPVMLYTIERGDKYDGYHFMQQLRTISDFIMYEEEFACLRRRSSKQMIEERSQWGRGTEWPPLFISRTS